VGRRRMALERVDHRQHVHGVAGRAHHDKQDSVEGDVDHGARR
jgi:hypothetical protein